MKAIVVLLVLLLCPRLVFSQDLENLKGQDPFRITGQIGTSNTFTSSSHPITYRDPIANQVFANLNFAIYGLDIPFSFYYSNRNTAFTHPFINMGISPRYKALKVHLGYRNMKFSSLTYNGLTFLGGGLEINNKWLRLGFFKGSLTQANAEDLQDINNRLPTYKRPAYGAKFGIGNNKNYLDLILFSAKDDSSSIPTPTKYRITPQENVVFGSNLKISPFKSFFLSAEVGASAYNYNMSSSEIQDENIKAFDQFFIPRYNTALRFAGVFKAGFSPGKWNTSIVYKYVQPDYVSLGTPYMTNNYRNIGWNFNSNLFKNKLSLNLMTAYQHDNLSNRQLYTNQIYNYTANLVIRPNEKFSLNNTYAGYRIKQSDGSLPVNDTTRLNRIMHNLTISPNYTLAVGKNTHTMGFMANYTTTENLNTLRQDFSDFIQYAAGATYSYYIHNSAISFSGNYNYQQSETDFYIIRGHTLGGGVQKKYLKEKNLGVQLNSNISFNSVGNISNNIVFNLQSGGTYVYKKNHNLGLRISLNYSKNQQSNGQYRASGAEFISNLSYTYRFAPGKQKKSSNAPGGSTL